MITYEIIKNDSDINTYIREADKALLALGYTEHSFAHVTTVAVRASEILKGIGKGERCVELAMIAGYLHDIGNLVNRVDHSQSGALISFRLLDKLGMNAEEIAAIALAIGNHDEGSGVPVSDLAAALIIADKSDVRRSRVRNSDIHSFDIHDRVNYSVTRSSLDLDCERGEITLDLTVDTEISSIMDYFEIFLGRMKLCRSAAERLGLRFRLRINNTSFI